MRGVLTLFFCLLLFNITHAQTCTGSLGDPVFKETFDAGTGRYGTKLASSVTNYNYSTSNVGDGSYTITNSSAGYNGNWYNKTDHTGDSGGYMMLINASNDPGVFYKQVIPALCGNTKYEFAAWILNLLIPNDNKPNITFKITTPEGVELKRYDTGDIANGNPEWKQYGLTFSTPTGGGDVILTMINNGPGGAGNDLALDDITFRPCGPVVISNFIGSGTPIMPACSGGAQSFTMKAAPATGYMVPAYQWQNYVGGVWQDIISANTTTYTAFFAPAVAGTYQYRLATAEAANMSSIKCRVISNVLTLTINDPPSSVINGSTTICEGDPLVLTSASGDTYSWTGPNNFKSNFQTINIASAKPLHSGTYNLLVTKAGCSTNTSTKVIVDPKPIATATGGGNICEGNSLNLHATGGVSYLWSPALGLSDAHVANPVASPTTTTTYTVTVTNAKGCTAKASTTVTVVNAPIVNAGQDVVMTAGQSVTLNGDIQGASYTFYWTPATGLSSATVKNPVATPTQSTIYTLHAIDGSGCSTEVTDDVSIHVYERVVVPNTFTPNNDGINDTWAIIALDTYPTALTQVFNRYGSLVYQTEGYSKAWDGKQNGRALPNGTYYYKIDLKNGQTLSGWVIMIR